MSFFDTLFGTTPAQTAVPTPTPTPTPTPSPTPPIELSPMDEFKTLWEPATTPTEVDGTLPVNMFASADPQKMLASARNVDFAK